MRHKSARQPFDAICVILRSAIAAERHDREEESHKRIPPAIPENT